MPMPGVFSAINTRLQGTLVGKDLRTLSEDLPEGIVEKQEGWVESKPVPDTQVFVKGKYDLLVKLPDSTYLLVDLKISQADIGKIDKYKTQLGSYKFALENPANGEPIKLTRLGLLIFYPDTVSFENGIARVNFPPKWLEVPVDEQGFLTFAKGVDKLLSGPMPEEGKECKWCKYRHLGDTLAHTEVGSKKDATIPF